MRISCGTDIIEINRIKDSIENSDGKFLERVFTDAERQYCESKKSQKYQHYAARFAAKEAVFKAISIKVEDKYSICWKDIEILNTEQGRPYVNLQRIEFDDIEQIDISVAHCKEYAIANVTVLWE